MKRWRTTILMAVVGLALMIVPVAELLAEDPITNLSLEDAQVRVDGVVKVDLVADTLPVGMSGFILAATTTDDGIAAPVLIEAPDYGLATVHQMLDGSFRLSVADLVRLVEAGATDVVLGTITYSGEGVGTTTADLLVTSLQDDNGFEIEHTVTPGLITVTPSRDLDGDGITEDIDGNGTFGFTDIVALFEMLVPPPPEQ